MIILSRPAADFTAALTKQSVLPSDAQSLHFYPRGRDALLAGLRALGVMPGDAIIVPAYICDSTIAPLRQAGYKLAFVDIESDLRLDPPKVLEAAEASGAKAVLAVHYFGFPSNVEALVALLRPRGIRVIEDCCHSFLTHVDDVPVGLRGDAAIFSMRKTLPIPDGGALRLNVADFDGPALGPAAQAAPPVARYLATRAAEGLVALLGWPNIYSNAMDDLKARARGTDANAHLPVMQEEPRRQRASRLLAHYLANEPYLRQVGSRVAENYTQLVEGASALGLRPHVAVLPKGCVPQWAAFDDPSGQVVSWMRDHGIGACRWPWNELPPEVAESPSAYPESNKLNQRLALLPVHQSVGRRQMSRMLRILGQRFGR